MIDNSHIFFYIISMSEFKVLSESKALDPYQDKAIKVVSKLKSPRQGMIDFFTYMAETGWNEYIKEDYLRKIISKFSIKTIENLYNEDTVETFTGGRNYYVLPKLQEQDEKRLMWKWQGNLMEIIAGNMFRQKVHPLTNKYELECWTGDSKDDMGVDGWCQHVSNPKFKIGCQVKYRLEKDVKWNDQISKSIAITEQTTRQLYRDGVISDAEWCQWGKIPARSIIVTTTGISDTIERAIGIESYDWIDSKDMLRYIGKPNGNDGNKLFWEKALASIM